MARLRTTAAAVGAITALAAVLRFATLGDQSLWTDEAVTAALVRESLGGMLSAIPVTESTPPLYYVLEWAAVRIWGTGEAGLRLLSALAGTLTVPVAYAATRTLLGRALPALAVALLVAVAPVLVWYSQEARSYALYVLLDTLALLFLARALLRPDSFDRWLWAAWAGLAVLTHYFAVFFAVASAAVLLVRLGRRALMPVLAVLAAGLAVLPLLIHQRRHDSTAWITAESLSSRLWEVPQRWAFLFYNPGRTVAVVLAVAVALLLAWRGRRLAGSRAAAAVALLAVGLPLLLALARIADVFHYRNVLAAWVPLAIVIAAGLPAARLGAALAAAFALPLFVSTVETAQRVELQRDSWRTAVRTLQGLPGPRVVSAGYWDTTYTLPYYWPLLEPLPPDGAEVSEVALVGRNPVPVALPGFQPTESLGAGNLTVRRLRATSPEIVRASDLPGTVGAVAR